MSQPSPAEFRARVEATAERLLAENPMFAVEQAEIRGARMKVFANAPASLRDIFLFGAMHGDATFLIYEGERWTFKETWEAACRLADTLTRDYGVGPGDTVAIAMRNYPEFCFAYMAAVSTGARIAPLNAWWGGTELAFALEDCGAKHVFVDGKRLQHISPYREKLGLKLFLARDEAAGADDTVADMIARAQSAEAPTAPIEPDSDFCVLYTSGSTGRPKGALLTHRGVVSAVLSWTFMATAVRETDPDATIFGDEPGALLAVPLFHVTGSHSVFLLSLVIGRKLVIMYRWDPNAAADIIERERLTNFLGVPTQSLELMNAAGDRKLDTLVDIGAGGAKRPPEHVGRLKKTFESANPSAGYGLTETNALGCYNGLADYQERPDSTGRVVPPVTEMKVVSQEGEDLGTDEVGELWIRSPAVFRGYLNLPEATAAALTPDGWFRTGDLARIDADGFVYIVDRIKDLIIRGGENVSALEVENAIYAHSDVAECSVFSVPDERLGERVGAAVLPKDGATIDSEALRAFLLETLAAFKTPERIWISPGPLPRLGTGKIDKRSVRAIAIEHPPTFAV